MLNVDGQTNVRTDEAGATKIYTLVRPHYQVSDLGLQCLHIILFMGFQVPYFFAYKTVFFYFQNNPKILDPSYKTDLDLWGCLGRVNFVLQQNCIGLI